MKNGRLQSNYRECLAPKRQQLNLNAKSIGSDHRKVSELVMVGRN